MESMTEFLSVAQWFVHNAGKIEEGWSAENVENLESYFLKKKSFSRLNINRNEDEDNSENDTEECKVKTLTCLTEHHILYNESYGVPVIYFSISEPSGRRISLAELWQHLRSTVILSKDSNMWSLLTEQIHPIIQKPFFVFHPCHTSDLMKRVNNSSSPRSFFLTWLSSVAPYVVLNLSLKYSELVKEENKN